MRKFALIYFVAAAIISYFLVKFQVFPGTIVIDWIVDSEGTYLIILAFGIMLLIFLVPLLLVFLIYNLIGGRKSEAETGVIDMAGITFSREKQLFGALFPMEILIDGKNKASVPVGKTIYVPMPPGERTIEVRCMQRSVIQRTTIVDHQTKSYRIGMRKMAGMQDVYMEEMTEDFQ